MTSPSLTYGRGYGTDCESKTSWNLTNSSIDTPTHVVQVNDYFELQGTCDDAGDEYFYVEYDMTNISSDVYTKYLVRWKTSASSNGLGAQVVLIFTVGDQYIVGSVAPEFSTDWTVSSGTITSGKTIDKIRLYANDEPNTVTAGTYQVNYDFCLLHKDTFTFPNVAFGLDFTPPPRYATIPISSRVGDITQNLGSESATVRASCDLDIDNDTNDWKRPQGTLTPKDDYVNGEVFMEIAHRSYTEPWQWLDTGKEQFKVTLENPVFRRMGKGHILDLLFREKRVSDASNELYYERFGLNL